MGTNHLESSQLPSPRECTNDDDLAQKQESEGLYETFPFGGNVIPIGIGTSKTLAKIDSGADLNLLSKRFFYTLPIQYRNELQAPNFIVLCANDSPTEMLGTVTLPISISGCKLSTKLHVMDGAHSDVYLGMPFLQQNCAILAFDGNDKQTLSLLIGVSVLADTYLPHTGPIHGNCYSWCATSSSTP